MRLLRVCLSAALFLAASISFAQTKPGDLVADVSFSFVVAGHSLPPGHYVINNLNDTVSIHGTENSGLFVPTHSEERPADENSSKLVFHRYGETYFLSEVWVGGNSVGKALFPSRAERKLRESGEEREIAVVRIGRQETKR